MTYQESKKMPGWCGSVVGQQPMNQEVTDLIPAGAHAWIVGSNPSRVVQEAANRCFPLIDVSISLSFSLPHSLKSIKILKKNKKRQSTEWVKVFGNHISNKKLMLRIHKKL